MARRGEAAALNGAAPAPTFRLREGAPPGARRRDDMDRIPTNFGPAMAGADYVLIDGVMFETEYLRIPDSDTVADDIVLEARNDSAEVALTRGDIDGAEDVGEGGYRLKSGALLRFLSSATVH